MSADIHLTAIVPDNVDIGDGAVIGPYVVIEDDVVVGPGTEIGHGSHIASGTRLGTGVKVFPMVSLGTVPQDLKFGGEKTVLEIGDRTVIREFVMMNRGTAATGMTKVGADCLFMSYSHVAHDCRVGDHCILANSATLAGHVTLDDWVIVGGLVPVHQFVKIGCHVMIGGGWRVPKDIPPYVTAAGDPLKPVSLNKLGLARRGFSDEALANLGKAYRILFRSKHDMKDALSMLDCEGDLGPEVEHLKDFIRTSERGVIM